MSTPTVTEIAAPREPVAHDTFIDDLRTERATARRPPVKADGARS
jgi:hypothetical protein